jgi:hypothetical protein
MRLDQQAARIEADDLRIGAGPDPLPDVRVRDRIERFVDGRELRAPGRYESAAPARTRETPA